jgi:hypothetical protein
MALRKTQNYPNSKEVNVALLDPSPLKCHVLFDRPLRKGKNYMCQLNNKRKSDPIQLIGAAMKAKSVGDRGRLCHISG